TDVLRAEMSLTQRQRAFDLFQHQRIDWSAANGLEYRLEGAITAVDNLGTAIKDHPIASAAVLGVGIAASMRAPSVMAAIGVASLGYQAGRLVANEAGALMADDAETRARR